ncbi:hypothetical protein DAPPUDRAFT_255316 [Daphnia pulex]|uniref:Uncharacterized protein n=1 Tax=Daphnia pulex TaxID=6669 RepID=E9H8Y4_DAPPU|nr:hypothetical protein DAPPUDRAFT_255316 [Daphnia pulex]|eukprot:EFX71815.1 hypothetical protein DAPPUDRAFT_255316 [Daphnia pulex]
MTVNACAVLCTQNNHCFKCLIKGHYSSKYSLARSFGRVLSCYLQSYVMNSAKQGRKRPAVDGFDR